MTTIYAKTVLRSRNASRPGKVLSTLLLRYPRWIHAELMTHRVFSRNAASSRAIPVPKLIRDMFRDPAHPLHWGRNMKGMQAAEQLSGLRLLVVKALWYAAMFIAGSIAYFMHLCGAHKQVVNRLLEPFSHITVLVSSTEWENFLELRDHKDAEPHIQMLAREIRDCLDDESKIQHLHVGDWHLPFVTNDDWAEAYDFIRHANYVYPNPDEPRTASDIAIHNLKKLSVARCASTSYKTVDGFDMTLEKAVQIYDKLVTSKPIHASPTEHVAQVDEWVGPEVGGHLVGSGKWAYAGQHGNFDGFRQLRFQL